jgi:molybdate transport system ATP-binding protein
MAAAVAGLDVNLTKRLPGFTLDVAWSAGDGVAVLFGPSGAGKTLTLQCLAGLIRPDAGRIALGERVLFDGAGGIDVPPQRRRIGYVFQGYALFPHLTVADNVGFGLRMARVPRREARPRIDEALALVGLTELADRLPTELSGGQQQRAAIARALVTNPAILLADEPTGNLDSASSVEIMKLLAALNAEQGRTIVLITHELDIARFAHRTVELRDGRIVRDERSAA